MPEYSSCSPRPASRSSGSARCSPRRRLERQRAQRVFRRLVELLEHLRRVAEQQLAAVVGVLSAVGARWRGGVGSYAHSLWNSRPQSVRRLDARAVLRDDLEHRRRRVVRRAEEPEAVDDESRRRTRSSLVKPSLWTRTSAKPSRSSRAVTVASSSLSATTSAWISSVGGGLNQPRRASCTSGSVAGRSVRGRRCVRPPGGRRRRRGRRGAAGRSSTPPCGCGRGCCPAAGRCVGRRRRMTPVMPYGR